MEQNPRFVAYARTNGNTPDAQAAADRDRFPGGPMAGFTTWLNARWRDWATEAGHDLVRLSAADHAAFDAWLTERTGGAS